MAAVLGAVLLVTVSLVLALKLGLLARASQALEVAQEGARVVANPDLDDDAKGERLRRNSTQLAILFITIVAITAGAVAAPLGALWGLDRLGLISLSKVIAMTASPVFILVSSVVGVAAWLIVTRWRR